MDDSYHTNKLRYKPELEKEIGRGGFAVVFSGKARRPGMLRPELCAVKRILKHDPNFRRQRFQTEIAIFTNVLKHELFVQFLGWYEDDQDSYLYIAMEYMEFGDLENHIKVKWSEGDTKLVARQLLKGLTFMHGHDILHRDLKPANIFPILLDNPPQLHIKIGDFGISKRLSSDKSTIAKTQTGTPHYMAPEAMFGEPTGYTNAVDLWALGCILYRMVTGSVPFENQLQVIGYAYQNHGYPKPELLLSQGLSNPGIAFIESLIQPDATKRGKAQQALENDWIASEPTGFQVTERLAQHFRDWLTNPQCSGTGPTSTDHDITAQMASTTLLQQSPTVQVAQSPALTVFQVKSSIKPANRYPKL
ncbi:kinase-like domain-containing protein [Sphaerosporella brunnea]|uniref:non-specific serine/threonine protein kinase n=1 Tax=Sphaerosporella brunnea TaxID=1250544 RepID=A0A5J5EKN1_9PEZI|nr:kinase-like domain-containing protein [Sphaerosporella brunnea]